MKYKLINLKNLIFIFIIIIISHNFNSAKNAYLIIKNEYNKRLVNSYEFCRNESIGFLDYVKKKYKINNFITIKNYFISPDPSWYFLNSGLTQIDQEKIILLGYIENREINFKKKDGYFFSEDIKYLNKINKISFNLKKKNKQKLSFNIYQSLYGEKKSIYKSDLIDLNVGINTIKLNLDVINYFNNSKIIIEFRNKDINKNLVIDEVNLFVPNGIDLSERTIFEKYENCYLISKND
jgi:hypothetical protein